MENDTIYRQAAIDAIERNACNTQRAIEAVKALPSVQPEVIRCKDCKKYDMHDHRCKHWNHGVVVMDWCSKAERKQDETD